MSTVVTKHRAGASEASPSIELRARGFAALGDPTRLRVMDRLALQDISPDALADALGLPGNLLAHHLRVLEGAGLIRRVHSQHDRRRVYVQAVPEAVAGLLPAADAIPARRMLFVCTHNSARSVLAEAIWRETSDVPCASAGTEPAERYHPGAVAAAHRHGIKIAGVRPRNIDQVLRPGDLVVSVCDTVREQLDVVADHQLHWSVPDPATTGTRAAFDGAVDELCRRVAHLAPRIARSNP